MISMKVRWLWCWMWWEEAGWGTADSVG